MKAFLTGLTVVVVLAAVAAGAYDRLAVETTTGFAPRPQVHADGGR
ncbi:MAG: hypothetical protein RLO51_27990 [Thalassobaculum sp.]